MLARRVLIAVLLPLCLILTAFSMWSKLGGTLEYPWMCDPFGYLDEAKEIRQGTYDFTVDSYQKTEVARVLTEHQVPQARWNDLLGPHACHYFSRSEKVGVQYPPGAGFALSLFPEGSAVRDLNRASVVVLLLLALGLIYLSYRRQNVLAAGLVSLTALLGMDLIRRLGDASYSMNALLVPLALSILALVAAEYWRKRPLLSMSLAAVSGALCGWAVLIRIAFVFILPAYLPFLWGRVKQLFAFAGTLLLFGAFPLLMFQRTLTGSPFQMTYDAHDVRVASLRMLADGASFYFGAGGGATYNWLLLVAALGSAGALLKMSRRALWGALLGYFVSAIYFGTHAILIHYYMIPGILAFLWFLVCGALSVEGAESRKSLRYLAYLPALVALGWCLGTQFLWKKPFRTAEPPTADGKAEPVAVPGELLDPHAWVYADQLAGALWYYQRKFTIKLFYADPEMRKLILDLACARGEPQYILADGGAAPGTLKNLKELGATLTERGKVGIYPYYRIDWRCR